MEKKWKKIEDFINSLEFIDKITPSKVERINFPPVPKPKDNAEIYAQNLILKNGLEYKQELVEILAETIRVAEDIRSWKIDRLLWTYMVILLFDIFTKAKNPMEAMKVSFLYGMSFHESMNWEEIDDEGEEGL